MKKLFRKAVSVLGSAALVGMTISGAAAASYPAPFDSGDYAVVYGSTDDQSAANTIANGLPEMGGMTEVSLGSDSYKLEKSSTLFHVGDLITAVVSSSVDDSDMENLLADGEYTDDDNDRFDYTQTITLAGLQLTMFENDEYKEDEPTLGFDISSNTHILNYTLNFRENPLISDLETSDMPILGKDYYVLTVSGANPPVITLLDSAVNTILAEGDTTTLTVDGAAYEVSITFVSATAVKLRVNGEDTDSIGLQETYRLDNGAYVGIKEILYNAKDTGISKVEFSLGGGQLELTSGTQVELNDDIIDGLTPYIVNTTTLSSISLEWNAEDDSFVTDDSEVVLPGFGTIKLSMTGVNFPVQEEIKIATFSDDYIGLDDFPLKDSVEDIPLLYTAGGTVFTGIGKDSNNQLLTSNNTQGNAATTENITFDDDLHDHFIVSWSDGNDAESYLMRATAFTLDGSDNVTTFQYRKDGAWKDAEVKAEAGDTFSMGNAELAVGAVNKDAETVSIWNNSAQTTFNTLWSEEGLKIHLPINYNTTNPSGTGWLNISNGTITATHWNLFAVEEDKDGDKDLGSWINVSLDINTDSEVTVQNITGGGGSNTEIGSTDEYRNFVYSALATEILHDRGPDQRTAKLVYHGDEVAADVYLTSTDITSSTGTTGQKTYMDSESASFAGKNIVVVGGSCANEVAASLLGGKYCGDAFTAETGIGPGQFLIQSFDYNGNVATLVAGYEKDDTAKAATFLANEANDVLTNAGDKYQGQSTEIPTAILI